MADKEMPPFLKKKLEKGAKKDDGDEEEDEDEEKPTKGKGKINPLMAWAQSKKG